MKQLFTLAALAALTFAAIPAFAADGPTPPRGGKMIERLDTDKDGHVSKAEFQAKGDEMFSKLDGDKDGKVSQAEFENARKKHMEERAKRKAARGADKAE